jgi:molecular chaperone GrpE (heat shock protein)
LEFIPYHALFEDAHKKYELKKAFDKNARFSAPVPLRRGERLYDAMFVYEIEYSERVPVITRPFAWMALPCDGGTDMLYAWCSIVDFIHTENYPLGSILAADLPKALSPKKVNTLHDELIGVYEQLRQFVFLDNLNREQIAHIVRYKELFLRLCFSGLYPFYHAMSPSFFQWLRLPLPEMRMAHIPKDIANNNDYEYYLLILETLQQMIRQFQEKISEDGLKQKLFDEMHEELANYRNGFVDNAMLSLVRDVIQLIDSITRSLKAFEGEDATPERYDKLMKLFDGVATDLTDMLYRQGVDPYEIHGDDVQVPRQKIITTQPAPTPAHDKKIAARLAKGWEKEGRVIRPEHVSVYIHKDDEKEKSAL